MDDPAATVAVIGAGPAGLAAARRLLQAGLNVAVFERRSQSGGTWFHQDKQPPRPSVLAPAAFEACPPAAISDDDEVNDFMGVYAPASACYESLTNNIPIPFMEFAGYKYPPDTGWFVSHRQVLKYLQDFSQDSGIKPITRHNTSVIKAAKRGDGKWWIATKSLNKDLRVTSNEDAFDYLVISTGHYDKPFVPYIRGLTNWVSNWGPKIIHSKEYRNNKSYVNQTVLILGAGSSAFDIGRDVAFVGKTVYQSIRARPGSDTRPAAETVFERSARSLIPGNVHRIPEITEFGAVEDTSDISKATIRLEDGTAITGIDRIIFCTGYRFSLPFLTDYEAPESHDISLSNGHLPAPIISDGLQLHNLHRDMLYVQDPTLAFMGVHYEISTFPFFDIQAAALASIFAGRARVPSTHDMQIEYQRRVRECGMGKQFHVLGWKKEEQYIRDLVAWIDLPDFRVLVQTYEGVRRDVDAKRLEAFRMLMMKTTRFKGCSQQEIAGIIEKKIDDIQSELALYTAT